MRTIILAAAAASLMCAVTAQAADVSRPMSISRPYAAPVSWSGFYIGGNVGYGWGSSFENTNSYLNTTIDNSIGAGNGLMYGGQIGYNWQLTNRWVAGLELSLDYANLKGSYTETWCTPGTCGYSGQNTTDMRLKWLGMANGKLGYLVTDRLLVGAQGGFAYGRIENTFSQSCMYCSGYTQTTTSAALGYDVGAFATWRINKTWSATIDYSYVDLTSQNQVSSSTGWSSSSHQGFHTNIVKLGINYNF